VARERSEIPNKVGPPPDSGPLLSAQLAELAAGQHGVVTAKQLGLSRPGIAYRVRVGTLHRVHRGVYAVGHDRLSERGRYMAAVLAAGKGAALSGLSAAALWKAWKRPVREIHVIAPRTRGPQEGLRIHTTRRLDPRDVTELDGIPVTTLARTLVDLTDVLTVHQLANVIHEAAYHELFDRKETYEAIQRANGRPNLTRLRQALETDGAGTRSNLEDRFLSLIADLPRPRVNTRIAGLEVDFAWPGLVVELDGPGHNRPRTQREDAERDKRLNAAGYTVRRITRDDLDRPAGLLDRLGLQPAPDADPLPGAAPHRLARRRWRDGGAHLGDPVVER
jgi:very-short-patch-repair endonuclease